jgi:hypothetical protein
MRLGALPRGAREKGDWALTGGLSMGLDRALADIEFGITEIRIKKTQ